MPQAEDQVGPVDEPLDNEIEEKSRLRAKRKRARRVLLAALLVTLAGLGAYGIWPWLLPPFVYEGPMVQMAGEHQVTLVWYMTRPVGGELTVGLRDFMQSTKLPCWELLT